MSSELARVIIGKVLGEYLENINSENISVWLWSGNLSLDNVRINSSAFDKFHLPVKIAYGKVGKVRMSIPYKSILMGLKTSVDIYLENIQIYSTSLPQDSWKFFDYTAYEYKTNLIRSFTEDLLVRINLSENPQFNNTYVNAMINNIIDNIKIILKDISIIHEDRDSHQGSVFFLGAQIKEISISSKEKDRGVINDDRIDKVFAIDEFSMFIVPGKREKVLTIEGLTSVSSRELADVISRSSENLSLNSKDVVRVKDYYIQFPVNLTMNLQRNLNSTPHEYTFDIVIDSIQLELEKKQFECVLKCIDYFTKYSLFYNNCYYYRRLKLLLPEKNEEKYYYRLLRHYFISVYKLVRERKSGVPQLYLPQTTLTVFKEKFSKMYKDFYFNESSLSNEEFSEMKKIIMYVDQDILFSWITDVVGDIYARQKSEEKTSGFFGGIKSYFYKSAIENITISEDILNKIQNPSMMFHVSMEIHTMCFSLSEMRINNVKEFSKIVFNECVATLSTKQDVNQVHGNSNISASIIVNELRFLFITKINNSYFSSDIVLPKLAVTENIFFLKFQRDQDASRSISVSLFSQTFIYNHNCIHLLSRFFAVPEFEEYSYMIKDTLGTIDLSFLQKYNLSSKETSCSVMKCCASVANQRLVFPMKSANDMVAFDLGNFALEKAEGNWNISFEKIKCEYCCDFKKWLSGEHLTSEVAPLIEEFSMKICANSVDNVELTCMISKLVINCNETTIRKIIDFDKIFQIDYDRDIWESVYETKNSIFYNSVKRGKLMLKSQGGFLSGETWMQYFTLLSGGYLYLFLKSDNASPDMLISLTNAKESNVYVNEISNEDSITQIYCIDIAYPNKQSFSVGIFSESQMLEWKNSIHNRILEIKNYLAIEEQFRYPALSSKRGIFDIDSEQKKLMYYQRVFSSICQEKDYYQNFITKLHFKLDHLEVNADLNMEHPLVVTLEDFDFSISANEVIIFVDLELRVINMMHRKGNDCAKVNIFSNIVTGSENMISSRIRILPDSIHDSIYNVDKEFESIENVFAKLKIEDESIQEKIRTISKTEISVTFSNMLVVYDPLVIKRINQLIRACGQRRPAEVKEQGMPSTREKRLVQLSFILKSLNLNLLNRKSGEEILSLALGESSVELSHSSKEMQVEISLGNFQVNDCIGLNISQPQVKEIVGLADKQKRSSLWLSLILLNFPQVIDNKKIQTKIRLVIESLKVSYIHCIIVRVIQSVIQDIMWPFTSDYISKEKEGDDKGRSRALSTVSVETFDLDVLIHNPTVVVFDAIYPDVSSYQLDFGTITVKNAIEVVNASAYYERYDMVFKDTNITCSDEFRICQPLTFHLLYSRLNHNEGIVATVLPVNVVKFYFSLFDFEIRRSDYLSFLKIAENNICLNDQAYDKLFTNESSSPAKDLIEVQGSGSPQLSLSLFNEILRVKIFAEKDKFIQFALIEQSFTLNTFQNHFILCSASKHFFMMDNSISVISNKKGIDKVIGMNKYTQLDIHLKKDYQLNTTKLDVNLADMKILIKMDVIDFLRDFFINEEKHTENEMQVASLNQAQKTSSKEWSKMKGQVDVNLCLLNNFVFLRSKPHFQEQEILFLEANVISSIRYIEQKDNMNMNTNTSSLEISLACQQLSCYTAKIFNFETDFDEIFNRRILVEPLDLVANLENKSMGVNKWEMIFEWEYLKMKISYDDFFFILNSLTMNFAHSGDNAQELTGFISKTNRSTFREWSSISNPSPSEIQLELFLNVTSVEVLIVNDISNVYIPSFQLLLSDFTTALSLDKSNLLKLKEYSRLSVNYFNNKIAIWEPFIEVIDGSVTLSTVEGSGYNIVLNIKSDLNFNISEELIHTLSNSYESFKMKYISNSVKDEVQEKEIYVSNHVLINYSGDTLIINDITIKNGDSFDLEETFHASHFEKGFLSIDQEFQEKLNERLESITFAERNLTVKSFYLNENLSSNVHELFFHDVFYTVQFENMRRNYLFYTKGLLENQTSMTITAQLDTNETYHLKYHDKIGLKDHCSVKISLNGDEQSNYVIRMGIVVVQENIRFLRFQIKDMQFILNFNQEKVLIGNKKAVVHNLIILPSVIIYNYLGVDVDIKYSTLIESESVTIKSNEKKCLHIKLEDMKFRITLSIDQSIYSSEDFSFDNISTERETSQKIVTWNARNKFLLKINSIEENGVAKLFIYVDYLIMNVTTYDIIPVQRLNENNIKSKELEYSNDGYVCRYVSVENFDNIELMLIDVDGEVYYSDEMKLLPEDYLYHREVRLSKIEDKKKKFQFIVQRYIKYFMFTEMRKIDILVIYPKYRVKNDLLSDILIKDKGNQNISTVVKSQSEGIIHSPSSHISIQVKYECQLTKETEYFNIDEVLDSQVLIQLNDDSDNDPLPISLSNNVLGLSSYLTVTETKLDNSCILITNRTSLTARVYQITEDRSTKLHFFYIRPNEVIPFCWTLILITKFIKVDLIIQDNIAGNETFLDFFVMEYDKVFSPSRSKTTGFIHQFPKQKSIYLITKCESDCNCIYLEEREKEAVRNEEDEAYESYPNRTISDNDTPMPARQWSTIKIISQAIVNVNAVNISLITLENMKRSELLLLNVNKISFIYINEVRNFRDVVSTYELKIKDIQVDNMSNNLYSPFKVNMFNIKGKDEEVKGALAVPFLHFICEFKENSRYTLHIQKLDFLIQSFAMCIDSEILFSLVKFIKSSQDRVIIPNYFYFENINDVISTVVQACSIKTQSKNNKIYIDYIRTSPINFLFSYKNISNKFFEEVNVRSSIVRNFIDAFSSNDKVNIQLKAIEMTQVFGDRGQIFSQICEYYYLNLISQAVKLMFSVDILGNPLGLIGKLGKGVRDFFYMPMIGFVTGPSEFIYGSYSGTKSLVFHAIGGALDSTQKITSSLGKNLLKFTNSEDYIQHRQSLFQLHSEGRSGRIMTGLKIFLLGIRYGLGDFMRFPYVYYKNNGVFYLSKGILLGLLSIFVKPATGVLDFLSFFSGNLARRVLYSYDQTFHSIRKKRSQRIFWGINKYIKSVDSENNLIDSLISSLPEAELNILPSPKQMVVKKTYVIKDLEGKYLIVIFFNDLLVIYATQTSRIIAMIHVINIEKIVDIVNGSDSCIRIIYIGKQLKETVAKIAFESAEVKENFMNFLLLLKQQK